VVGNFPSWGFPVKTGPKRTPEQVLRDRAETAKLYIQGWPQHEIAAKVGVTREQITYDLARIREEWVRQAQASMGELVARELAKLDRIEAEAWAAWERSRRNRERKRTKKTTGARDQLEAAVESEERDGDPRWLAEVRECVAQRCKLLGINAPEQHQHTGKDGGPIEITTEPSDDERLQRLNTTIEAAYQRSLGGPDARGAGAGRAGCNGAQYPPSPN
jgi:hypothetical protein